MYNQTPNLVTLNSNKPTVKKTQQNTMLYIMRKDWKLKDTKELQLKFVRCEDDIRFFKKSLFKDVYVFGVKYFVVLDLP